MVMRDDDRREALKARVVTEQRLPASAGPRMQSAMRPFMGG
jgi:hypothetical protein